MKYKVNDMLINKATMEKARIIGISEEENLTFTFNPEITDEKSEIGWNAGQDTFTVYSVKHGNQISEYHEVHLDQTYHLLFDPNNLFKEII